MGSKGALVATKRRDALTELIRQRVGEGRRWSVREFAEVAVDPETRWGPSKSLLGKIIKGDGYKITPELVSAVAAGLGLPRPVVEAAAHWQVIGFERLELSEGASPLVTLVHYIGLRPGDAPLAQAVSERWEAEESEHAAEGDDTNTQ